VLRPFRNRTHFSCMSIRKELCSALVISQATSSQVRQTFPERPELLLSWHVEVWRCGGAAKHFVNLVNLLASKTVQGWRSLWDLFEELVRTWRQHGANLTKLCGSHSDFDWSMVIPLFHGCWETSYRVCHSRQQLHRQISPVQDSPALTKPPHDFRKFGRASKI